MISLREQVLEEARSWIGTPFRHQGRIKGECIDCVGLVYEVGKSLNIIDHDMTTEKAAKYQGYTTYPKDSMIRRACLEYLVPVAYADLQPADLILMSFTKEPAHIAIYTGHSIIHALSKLNNCVEHSIDNRWQRRFQGYYRYPGIENE